MQMHEAQFFWMSTSVKSIKGEKMRGRIGPGDDVAKCESEQ